MAKKDSSNFSAVKIFLGTILGGIITTFSTPSQAIETFDNSGVQFDVDTIVEFGFVESHGAYQSTFGVINLDTGEKTPLIVETKPSDNPQDVERPSKYRDETGERDPEDFLGSPGNTVPQPLASYRFKANTRYAFYLESTYNGKSAGILYSANAQNPGGNQQVKFQGGLSNLAQGGSLIRWDDTGSLLVKGDKEDMDFNDFIVRIGGHIACPYERNVTSNQQLKEQSYNLEKGFSKNQSPSCQSSVKAQ